MKNYTVIFLLVSLFIISCQTKVERLRTDRTSALVRELLTKLDSADFYAARKEAEIELYKQRIGENSDYHGQYEALYKVAEKYSHYNIDSSLVYFEKAVQVAADAGDDNLRISAQIRLSTMLTIGGFYMEAAEILNSVPREVLQASHFAPYYNAWMTLYRDAYASSYEPDNFRHDYQDKYEEYRDSLLRIADTMSVYYLRNMERKLAKEGNFEEARRYNAIRISDTPDHRSYAYATSVYDRFMIAYHYEDNMKGEDVDDLLQAAIIELEYCNRDINSMLIVITLLNEIGEIEDAKKVSDYYYDALQKFRSRKRLIECGEKAMIVNEENFSLLQKKNRQFKTAILFISLLAVALFIALFYINSSRRKIIRLKDNLQRSGMVSKGYVGVVFKLYSSYIKRLDAFRLKIYTTLKKGNVEQTLELASPSKDLVSNERRDLFHHFDTAFVDIFPDYIEKVNSFLKPEMRITPKRTEILNTELRILALIKLGIEDNEEIAEMLHCTVKTVMNQRAVFRSRLAVPEKVFNKAISEL